MQLIERQENYQIISGSIVSSGFSTNINGTHFNSSEKGYARLEFYTTGDLILKINMIKHDGFEKVNNDMVYTTKLNVNEFSTIKNIEIPHPDTKISIPLPDKLDTDKPLRVRGKGYKIQNNTGDLYIKLGVFRDLSE